MEPTRVPSDFAKAQDKKKSALVQVCCFAACRFLRRSKSGDGENGKRRRLLDSTRALHEVAFNPIYIAIRMTSVFLCRFKDYKILKSEEKMSPNPFKQILSEIRRDSNGATRATSMRLPGAVEFSLRSLADLQGVPFTRLAVMILEAGLEEYAPLAVAQDLAENPNNQISDLRPSAIRERQGDILVSYSDPTFGTLTKAEQMERLETWVQAIQNGEEH